MLHAKFSNMACGKFKFTNYTKFCAHICPIFTDLVTYSYFP